MVAASVSQEKHAAAAAARLNEFAVAGVGALLTPVPKASSTYIGVSITRGERNSDCGMHEQTGIGVLRAMQCTYNVLRRHSRERILQRCSVEKLDS